MRVLRKKFIDSTIFLSGTGKKGGDKGLNPPEGDPGQAGDASDGVKDTYIPCLPLGIPHVVDLEGGHEEGQVPDEKDQPNARPREAPPRIYPDELAGKIQEALDEHAERGEKDREKPAIRDPEHLGVLLFREEVAKDDARDGEHEKDFKIPPDEDDKCGISRGRPERGIIREVEHVGIPHLVDEVLTQQGEAGKNGAVIAILFRFSHLHAINVEDDGEEGDDIPLGMGKRAKAGERLQALRGRYQ